jgi:CCR4-NOT transcription complex subunit 3
MFSNRKVNDGLKGIEQLEILQTKLNNAPS